MSGDATDPDELLTYDGWVQALRDDGRLVGQRCRECDHATAAPKAACARCGGRDLETVDLPTDGEVYTVTTINAAPAAFEGPYHVGLVTVGDARVMAHFEDAVDIGDRVELAGFVEDTGSPGPLFE